MKGLKTHSVGAIHVKMTVLFIFMFTLVGRVLAVGTSVSILPGAPLNVAVAAVNDTQVQLTWDASLSPSASIASYKVYYKLNSNPTYPVNPQITRVDSLASYSESINVTAGVAYDFKIVATAVNGLASSSSCASCETTYNPNPGGGGGSGGGGGGGGGGVDSAPPQPGAATSPSNSNAETITVTYSGASDVGGSGLASVILYYKKDSGTWVDSGLVSPNAFGSFEFTPQGDGLYHFDLRAFDGQGNASPVPTGETGDTQTLYDHSPPGFETLFMTDFDAKNILHLSYEGAIDQGSSGLKQVQLWYKNDPSATWINSGLTATSEDGSFDFPLPTGGQVYYFSLLLEDQLGNTFQTTSPYGDLSLNFSDLLFQVILMNLPSSITDQSQAEIQVAGANIVSYKYQLNQNAYSDEISVDEPITLSDLQEGVYKISVIGKNDQGLWQPEDQATAYEWTVDFSTPDFFITGPFSGENDTVTYELSYGLFDQITLTSEDIFLINGGHTGANILLTQVDDFHWTIILSDITGDGQLGVGVVAGTASYGENKLAPGLEGTVFSVSENQVDLQFQVISNQPSLAEVFNPVKPSIIPPAPEFTTPLKDLEAMALTQLQAKAEADASGGRFYPSIPKTDTEFQDRLEQCQIIYPGATFENQYLDFDQDGLSNRTECYILTNPVLSDSDLDGCSDGDEVNFFGLNPLNDKDCSLTKDSKSVWIVNPQNQWTVPYLQVMGLTSSETSRVDLIAFPFSESQSSWQQGVHLGTVSTFDESALEGYYFFDWPTKVLLKNKQVYDLVAISTLQTGEVVTSLPVRFTLDTQSALKSPVPLAIEDQPIDPELKLNNIQVWFDEGGKIHVSGESEYGVQVFAVWRSLVLASSIINDSDSGLFEIESPFPLEVGQQHMVRLYAVKQGINEKVRSENVDVPFFLHGVRLSYYFLLTVIFRCLMLMLIFYLRKHE